MYTQNKRKWVVLRGLAIPGQQCLHNMGLWAGSKPPTLADKSGWQKGASAHHSMVPPTSDLPILPPPALSVVSLLYSCKLSSGVGAFLSVPEVTSSTLHFLTLTSTLIALSCSWSSSAVGHLLQDREPPLLASEAPSTLQPGTRRAAPAIWSSVCIYAYTLARRAVQSSAAKTHVAHHHRNHDLLCQIQLWDPL